MSIDIALETFRFAFSVTAPIFLMIVLGVFLKRRAIINEGFVQTASRLVFNPGLPALLFVSCATADLEQLADTRLTIAMLVSTLVVFICSSLAAPWHIKNPQERGVFVQGAFRGNLVILGLAFCANAFGDKGVAIASMPIALTVIAYNVLSVYTLNASLNPNAAGSWWKTCKDVLRNPLIVATIAGFAVNFSGLPLPAFLLDTARYLGNMVLPLALICIGGALDLRQMRRLDSQALMASFWKLILTPIIAIATAVAVGVKGDAMTVLFLLAASPTATVSFVMVQAMGGNSRMAANIIVQTTLFSLLTVTLGLWLIQWFHLA